MQYNLCNFAQMHSSNNDILSLAQKQPVLYNELDVLFETERNIPGSINYSIKRYKRQPQWSVDDMGLLEYNYNEKEPADNMLTLKFCLSGNVTASKNKPNVIFVNSIPHQVVQIE